MKCVNCGFESQEDFKYCSNCGAAATVFTEPTPSVNRVAEKFLPVFRDKLFLVICILMTATCVFAILAETFSIINILIAIFLWIIYSNACKGVVNAKSLRRVSGAVYANYIITNVVSGILIFCGVILMLAFRFLANTSELMDKIMDEIEISYPKYLNYAESIASIIGWIIGFVLLLIAAICLVINLLGMRKIHRFAKSVYRAILTQTPYYENPRAVRNWLIFFGVRFAVSSVSCIVESVILAISVGCLAAANIIAAVMIKKYFLLNVNNYNGYINS